MLNDSRPCTNLIQCHWETLMELLTLLFGKLEARVVVLVSTSRSRNVFFKRLGLGIVWEGLGLVSDWKPNVSSRSRATTSRLQVDTGHLNKFFIFFFIFLEKKRAMSFSYIASSFTCFRFVKLKSSLIMRPTRSHLSPSKLAKLVFLKCNKHAAM